MKSIPTPNLFIFIFFITTFLSSSSKAGIADTTILLAGNINDASYNSEFKPLVKSANVSYPTSLQKHLDQSIDYVQKFSNKKREHLIQMYQKGKKYFPKVTEILKRYNLPEELKVLLALESGFNGNARSKAGAVGYWQIMDDVAKEYGLQIIETKNVSLNKLKKKDDRKNFMKSTLAAVKYLSDRGEIFNNDLLLIVASYNCGSGKVWNAIKKSGRINPDFWEIKKYLPAETRNFVMNFILLNVIFSNYENFANNTLVFAPQILENTIDINSLIPAAIID